ncbi:MAG: hypothetical protein OSA44_06170 [Nitrospinaceae bacterium]|nr:hypothetical protein [Nitrospinaceae bacterium]
MTLDGGRISITALSPLTARQHPPILPFLLAYMSGLCGFFPATRHFIAPGLLPLGLFLFALFLTHRKYPQDHRNSLPDSGAFLYGGGRPQSILPQGRHHGECLADSHFG